MDNRGIDTDPGWINRKLRDLQKQIEDLRSEKRFRALPTTSASANMVVDATTGGVARSTSSDRYKQDIEDLDLDLDLVDVLAMRPRVWRDKSDVAKRPGSAPRYVGFIAEELHDAGLGLFVGYDTEGKPESVNYDRLTVALLIGCKVLAARIASLTTRTTATEAGVADLNTAGAALSTRTNNLAGRSTALEKAVADLTARATEQDATIADLTARVSALETAAATTPVTE